MVWLLLVVGRDEDKTDTDNMQRTSADTDLGCSRFAPGDSMRRAEWCGCCWWLAETKTKHTEITCSVRAVTLTWDVASLCQVTAREEPNGVVATGGWQRRTKQTQITCSVQTSADTDLGCSQFAPGESVRRAEWCGCCWWLPQCCPPRH